MDNQNKNLNKEMSGSTRRSRLGLGVSNWNFPSLGAMDTKTRTEKL